MSVSIPPFLSCVLDTWFVILIGHGIFFRWLRYRLDQKLENDRGYKNLQEKFRIKLGGGPVDKVINVAFDFVDFKKKEELRNYIYKKYKYYHINRQLLVLNFFLLFIFFCLSLFTSLN